MNAFIKLEGLLLFVAFRCVVDGECADGVVDLVRVARVDNAELCTMPREDIIGVYGELYEEYSGLFDNFQSLKKGFDVLCSELDSDMEYTSKIEDVLQKTINERDSLAEQIKMAEGTLEDSLGKLSDALHVRDDNYIQMREICDESMSAASRLLDSIERVHKNICGDK